MSFILCDISGPQPIVNLFTPEALEIILKSSVHLEKPDVYESARPWLRNGILISEPHKWHIDRKLLTPAFHYSNLERFIPIINKHCRTLCEVIENYPNMIVDNAMHTFENAAFDILCETSFGTDLNIQRETNSFADNFHLLMELGIKRTFNPIMLKSEFLFSLSNNGRKYFKAIKAINVFTMNLIRKRKEALIEESKCTQSASKIKSLLDLMLDIHLNDGKFTLDDIQDQVNTFEFAGQDTLAVGISLALFELSHNQEVQDRTRQELNDVLGDSTEITKDHLNQLTYLEKVIKECLRLYPPAPFGGRLLAEDTVIEGYTIPSGSFIWMLIGSMHRNPTVWSDPLRFDPERFSAENSAGRHPFAYIPFSKGIRNCIGQKYAMLVMKITLAAVLRKFKLYPITKREEMVYAFEATLKAVNKISIGFKQI